MNSGSSNDLNRNKIDPRTGEKFSFNMDIDLKRAKLGKAAGLSRSPTVSQLSVSVYDVTIRNTYTDPESCHRPTIWDNVRTTSVLEDFFSRLSNDQFHWSTMA